jgi:hypothetical protein
MIAAQKANPSYAGEAVIDALEGMTDSYSYIIEDGTVQANPGECLLMINGTFEDTKGYINNGRSMVPIRFITETLGAVVGWDEENATVSVKTDEVDLSLSIGKDTAAFNGKDIKLDSPAVIIDDRTYVPLRIISECLGKSIGFVPAQGKGIAEAQRGIAYCPVVWIDDSNLTEENTKKSNEILAWLKPELTGTLNILKDTIDDINGEIYAGANKNTFVEIEQKINDMKYLGQVGRYLMFSGPYVTLVDPANNEVYFYYYGHGFGTISSIDVNNPELFIPMYFSN